MKNWKLPLALLAALATLWLACRDTDFQPNGPAITATFAGQVVDEHNQPLSGALVTAGDASASTDFNGAFRLKPARLSEGKAILHVSLPGFFEFSRAFVLKHGALQTVSVQLLKKQLVQSFTAGQSSVAQVGKAQLRFPANSVARSDGSAYNGIVSVYARYLDPESPDLRRHMPGDLRGVNTAGDEQTLATFGMIGVELTTPGGEMLQVAADKSVEIALPIPPGKTAVAPQEISLWHFDTDNARWVEEGTAQKTGDAYVGSVRHFSFWNCDVGLPLVTLSGRVLNGASKDAFKQISIKLTVLSNGWEGYGSTDDKGYFGGKVLANEALKMEIQLLDLCGQWSTLYTQTIGPFNADATLPDVTVAVPAVSSTTLSGRLVDCNNNPVAHGYVQFGNSVYSRLVFTGSDGTFKEPFLQCTSNPINVTGFNLDALTTSQTQNIPQSPGTVALGDIQVCTTPAEYAEITIDGIKYNFIGVFECFSEGGYMRVYAVNPDQNSLNFAFQDQGKAGTFALSYFSLHPQADSLNSANISTQLTQYGTKGQALIGTLSGTFQIPNAPTKTVTGKYRIIRDN